MILSEPVVEERRCRLNHEMVTKNTGISYVGGVIAGLVSMVAGIFIILLGLDILPAQKIGPSAPRSVAAICGAVFVAGGFFFLRIIKHEQRLIRNRQLLAKQNPHSLAYADYPWDPTGTTKSPWATVAQGLAYVGYTWLLLILFNWGAWFSENAPLLMKIITSLFTLVGLGMFVVLIRSIVFALRYGQSRLEYSAFPVVIGSRADLRWFPPAGLKEPARISFILRCVEEWMESWGSDRNQQLIHEQLWSATSTTVDHIICRSDQPVALSFHLPSTVPSTNLTDKIRATFWELKVVAEAPVVNFQEQYLVPVYTDGDALETPFTENAKRGPKLKIPNYRNNEFPNPQGP